MGTNNNYDEYKNTEMPWLQQIPVRWDIARSKNLYRKETRAVRPGDDVVTCFRDGTVTLRKNRRVTGFTESIKEIGYQGIRKGDLVIHVMDAFAGAIGVSDSDGKGSPVYSVCTAKIDLNNKYYAHVLRKMARQGYIKALYRGIRERSSDFRFETFSNLLMPMPPKEEQDQIVRYLDSKLAKSNKFVRNKKRLIELLKEQKQAVINQAVTKGLDSEAKMKHSGVEWIGDVPEGWNILYLFQTAKNQRISNKPIKNNNRLSLSYGKIVARDINSTDGLLPTSFDTYQVVKDGNIILRLTDLHNDHTSLRVGLVTQEGIITSAYTCLKVGTERIIPSYMYQLLHVYDIRKVFYGMGSGVRQSMSFADIKKLPLCIPPIQEQQDIIKVCNKITTAIDNQVALINKEIDLITEYRASLISAVVTGKVDVRGRAVVEPPAEDFAEPDLDDIENEELQGVDLLESEVG